MTLPPCFSCRPSQPVLPCVPQIFVRSLSGATVTVGDLAGASTVAATCEALSQKVGFECDELRMVFQGKQLEMSSSLAECSIEHGARPPCCDQLPCQAAGSMSRSVVLLLGR